MNANSTNGSTLEDCFTNTFAIADLANIKWKGYGINHETLCNQNQTTSSTLTQDALECPVLSSYIKCLNKDVLCVWRRMVNNNVTTVKDTTNSKYYTKQLWCFWFNNEPDWRQLMHKDLTPLEQSDYDHGLSYECRTLLFKAYHNLIEQSLISIGFCKFGKFFIFPIEQHHQNLNSSFNTTKPAFLNNQDCNQHFGKLLQNTIQLVANSNRLAFSFNFFIHGESTVCCIIDVRLKNPIYKLTKSHLTNALHQQQQIDVILSPFGLSATLTGNNSIKETDNHVQKMINDWRKFFPSIQQLKDKQVKQQQNNSTTPSLISSIAPLKIETLEDTFNSLSNKQSSNNNQSSSSNQLPIMVEVIVAGIKMSYPSNFVFMLQPNEHLIVSKKRSIDNLCKLESSNSSNKKSSVSLMKNENLHQETVQDLLFTPKQQQFKDHNQLEKNFNFKVSPAQPQLPTMSYCIRSNLNQELNCLSLNQPSNNLNSSLVSSDESSVQTFNKWDIYDVTCKLGCQCSKCKPKKSQKDQLKSSSSSNQLNKKLDKSNEKENKQSGNYQVKFNIPFHRRNFVLTNAYDLESSRCFAEVTNESIDNFDKYALTNNNSINNNSQSTKLPNYFCKNPNHLPPTPMKPMNQASSEMDVDPQSKLLINDKQTEKQNEKQINENSTNQQQIKDKFEEDMFSPYSGDKSNTNSPNLAAVQWTTFQSSSTKDNKPDNDKKSFKNDISDDYIVVSCFNKNLYKKYTHRLGAIKRPLLPGESHLNVNCNQTKSHELLYDFESIKNLNVNWELPAPKNKRLIKGLVSEEGRSSLFGDNNCDNEDSSRDPYEFDDDCMKNSKKSISTEKSSANNNNLDRQKLDEQNSNNKQSLDNQLYKVLTREEDIVVSYNGPDRIFDSSGDESNDMFSVPGNYNYNNSKLNGNNKSTNNNTINNTSNMLCDITHMFPTPPSLEQNTAPSPYSSFINSTESALNEDYITKDKLEPVYPLSPLDNLKEIACVYSTPLQTEFITSSKFSPLPMMNVANLKLPDECNYESKKLEEYRFEKRKMENGGLNSIISSLNPLTKQSASNHPTQKTASATNNQTKAKKSGYTDVQSLINSSSNDHLNQNKSNNNLLSYGQTTQINNSKPFSSTNSSSSFVSFNSTNGIKSQDLITSSNNNQYSLMPIKKEPLELPASSQFNQSTNQLIHSNSNLPEINSLMVTLVLSDSMLNIHKDHNFESCPLCICNSNIKGSDIDIYLPDNLMPNDEPQYKCSCGFSALENRHRSSYAGLFYEDEFEITNVCYDPLERLEKRSLFNIDAIDSKLSSKVKNEEDIKELRLKHDQLEPRIIDLLKSQCSVIFSTSSLLSKSLYFKLFKKRKIESSTDDSNLPILLNPKRLVSKRIFLQRTNVLLRSDCCEITFLALMLGKQGLEGFPHKSILQQYNQIENVRKRKQDCIHEWVFDNGTIHPNNYEVVQFLKNMQTLLQETALKKLRDLGGIPSSVKGLFKLLTWRELYKLTGRSEDQSEPQPIPSLLVAHDRDWIALSPFALKWWKECSLEPYSFTRDIGYIVLCPDTEQIINGTKSFFKDLSSVYQMLKLGKHKPIYKIARDGIIPVGKENNNLKSTKDDLDEWFDNIGNGPIASKLKMYAHICKQLAVGQDNLKSLNLDKSIFEQHSTKNSNSTNVTENGANVGSTNPLNTHQSNLNKINSSVSSPLNTSETMNGIDKPTNEDANQEGNFNANQSNTNHETADTDDDIRQPHIVIYIIEPFTFTNLDEDTYRVSCLGLLRCYLQMIENLPENLKNNINLQIVSLDSVLQSGKDALKSTRYDQFKSLAFSVFNQCRKVLVHQSISKSLTGFGPAASLENYLKSKDSSITNISKVYMPPFILAPLKDKQTELGEMFGDRTERSQVLFASYCLTEDQKFIAVTCCNDKGDLVENSLINIRISDRIKHKKANVIRFALQKLMDFLISVMSESTQPWRLVLNKIGRVGHNELKEWANFLSKRSLLKFSKQLKEKCKQCSYLPSYEMPSILSACLTSLEPDTNLRVFADQFVENEMNMNSCQLSTPEEASTTHLLVFPTSSTTQSSQGNYPDPLGASLAEDEDMFRDLGVGGVDDLAVDDIFDWGSPGSPARDQNNQLGSPRSRNNAFDTSNLRNMDSDIQDEEPCQLLQQPLSLGYYVSTAKTGKLPRWFWTSCQHLEDCNPAFLKSALLINTPSVHQVNEDLYGANSSKSSHPLDSHYTTDVLRYVLESYNSLSWLVLDPSTHDRMSCLPLQIQLLMQLYHTAQALF